MFTLGVFVFITGPSNVVKCAMVPDEKTALYISAPNKMVRRCDAAAAALEQPQARRIFSPQACIDWWWQWRRCTTDDKLIVAIQSNVHLFMVHRCF